MRSAGALLHLSSLDGEDGIGDLGPSSRRFLDWLAKAGVGWWQMLPIGPVGTGNSPYDALSSFAGETLFLSLDGLVDEGWLDAKRLRAARRPRQPPSRGRCRRR